MDISDIILGENRPTRKQPVMWLRPTDHDVKNGIDYPDLAIRKGDFKLLVNFDGSGVELFNIRKDEAETANLAEKYPEIANKLKECVFDWHSKVTPPKK